MARVLVRGLVALGMAVATLAAEAVATPTVRVPVNLGQPASEVTVQRGDHFWKISAAELSGQLGREPSDAEIWPYWRQMIAMNLDTIRSGDPDLIYPGEVLAVP